MSCDDTEQHQQDKGNNSRKTNRLCRHSRRYSSAHSSRSSSFNASAAEVILGLFQEGPRVHVPTSYYDEDDPIVQEELLLRSARDPGSWVSKLLARPELSNDDDAENGVQEDSHQHDKRTRSESLTGVGEDGENARKLQKSNETGNVADSRNELKQEETPDQVETGVKVALSMCVGQLEPTITDGAGLTVGCDTDGSWAVCEPRCRPSVWSWLYIQVMGYQPHNIIVASMAEKHVLPLWQTKDWCTSSDSDSDSSSKTIDMYTHRFPDSLSSDSWPGQLKGASFDYWQTRSPTPLSLSQVQKINREFEAVVQSDGVTSSHDLDAAMDDDDSKTSQSQDIVTNLLTLKRKRSSECNLPMTPRRGFGGSLTNLSDQVCSSPVKPLHPKKRRRLQLESPFDVFSTTGSGRRGSGKHRDLEEVLRDLNRDVKEQTKVLSAILEVLREKTSTN